MTHRDLGVAPVANADVLRLSDVYGGIYRVGSTEVLNVPVNRICFTYWHTITDGRIINNGMIKTS